MFSMPLVHHGACVGAATGLTILQPQIKNGPPSLHLTRVDPRAIDRHPHELSWSYECGMARSSRIMMRVDLALLRGTPSKTLAMKRCRDTYANLCVQFSRKSLAADVRRRKYGDHLM